MKSFIKRNIWVMVASAILLTVLACGLIASFTDADMAFFDKPLNEENLLFDTYKTMTERKDTNGLEYENRDGVIVINGKIADTEAASTSVFSLTKVTLKAGTYTYTCFDKATINTYYSYLKYTDADGEENIVFGDFESTDESIPGYTVNASNTFTLDADTEVEVIICIKPGVNCFNLKAYPTLVEGKVAGEFYGEKK